MFVSVSLCLSLSACDCLSSYLPRVKPAATTSNMCYESLITGRTSVSHHSIVIQSSSANVQSAFSHRSVVAQSAFSHCCSTYLSLCHHSLIHRPCGHPSRVKHSPFVISVFTHHSSFVRHLAKAIHQLHPSQLPFHPLQLGWPKTSTRSSA